jgi:hypothetical protein
MAELRLKAMEVEWQNATEREKRSRTLYAQASLRPEEVARELREAADALGDHRMWSALSTTGAHASACRWSA